MEVKPIIPSQSSSVHAIRRVDFAGEIDVLLQEAACRNDGCSARTLASEADLRTVLFAARTGSWIPAQRARGGVSLRVLAGHLEVHVGDAWDMLPYLIRNTEGACSFFSLYDHTIDLPVGSLITLERGFSHDVEALEDSAFILEFYRSPSPPP